MINSFLLGMFCANISFLPGSSCGPTSEAVVKQVGIYQNIDLVEGYAKARVHEYTPKIVEHTAGYGAAAYKFSKGEEARIGFKIPDFCDRLELGGSKSSQNIVFKWNF